jgi:enoyl-[acyl-carrier-protein] reductase (NADH)
MAPWANARPTTCQYEEIANAVLFFGSDEASLVGGVELFVDGG